ncbi:MAG TPA: helix-turn-helix domain-containing protein, partial [Myxococcaceae bacterium]|nr:helix-turn-helix domain-containing protein [Myxococcaceae bacterium]
VDTTADTTQSATLRNVGQLPARKSAYPSRSCNMRQLRLTRQDLAGMVACTRAAVTKEMSRFRRAGLIEARRGRCRVVVLDEPRLVDVARAGSAGSAVYSKA